MHRRNKRPFSPSSFHKTRSKHPRSSIRSTLFALGRASVDAGRNSSSQTTRPLINNSNVPKINSGDSRNGFQRQESDIIMTNGYGSNPVGNIVLPPSDNVDRLDAFCRSWMGPGHVPEYDVRQHAETLLFAGLVRVPLSPVNIKSFWVGYDYGSRFEAHEAVARFAINGGLIESIKRDFFGLIPAPPPPPPGTLEYAQLQRGLQSHPQPLSIPPLPQQPRHQPQPQYQCQHNLQPSPQFPGPQQQECPFSPSTSTKFPRRPETNGISAKHDVPEPQCNSYPVSQPRQNRRDERSRDRPRQQKRDPPPRQTPPNHRGSFAHAISLQKNITPPSDRLNEGKAISRPPPEQRGTRQSPFQPKTQPSPSREIVSQKLSRDESMFRSNLQPPPAQKSFVNGQLVSAQQSAPRDTNARPILLSSFPQNMTGSSDTHERVPSAPFSNKAPEGVRPGAATRKPTREPLFLFSSGSEASESVAGSVGYDSSRGYKAATNSISTPSSALFSGTSPGIGQKSFPSSLAISSSATGSTTYDAGGKESATHFNPNPKSVLPPTGSFSTSFLHPKPFKTVTMSNQPVSVPTSNSSLPPVDFVPPTKTDTVTTSLEALRVNVVMDPREQINTDKSNATENEKSQSKKLQLEEYCLSHGMDPPQFFDEPVWMDEVQKDGTTKSVAKHCLVLGGYRYALPKTSEKGDPDEALSRRILRHFVGREEGEK